MQFRAREGRLVRADSCVSVCQPSLVLPPSFDSDWVELLYTQGVRTCVLFHLSHWQPLPKSLGLHPTGL
ncbi:hypothetical protein [Acinetobacter pittii]|uniref:hypothetical protein n=1 Tax=Acinetobacter pittii TaxID=48296 RepID=UPI002027C4AA|nr:hypothetical protein [Acinetobacter pittii]